MGTDAASSLALVSLVNGSNSTDSDSTDSEDKEIKEDKDKEISTKGCPEGYGYHKDGPYKCYLLDSIGEDPPEGVMYCAALGCPYSPPDLSKD